MTPRTLAVKKKLPIRIKVQLNSLLPFLLWLMAGDEIQRDYRKKGDAHTFYVHRSSNVTPEVFMTNGFLYVQVYSGSNKQRNSGALLSKVRITFLVTGPGTVFANLLWFFFNRPVQIRNGLLAQYVP